MPYRIKSIVNVHKADKGWLHMGVKREKVGVNGNGDRVDGDWQAQRLTTMYPWQKRGGN
jgi:hypothetical protein